VNKVELNVVERTKVQKLFDFARGKKLVKRQHDIDATKQIFIGQERITDKELLEAWELIERRLLVTTPTEFDSGWYVVQYELPNSLLNETVPVN